MPELPEIETVKLQLQKHLIGKTIDHLAKLHVKSVQGNIDLVKGKKIISIERKGKMLIIKLNNNLNICIHFKMTGQLIFRKFEIRNSKFENYTKNIIVGGHPSSDWIGELPNKHTRAVFQFIDKSKLYFNDQRLFGWIKILDDNDIQSLNFLKNLGPEPWDINDQDFYNIISKKKKSIKLTIMDQEILAGVGNIYANDSLWEAGIDPKREGKVIRQEESKKLRDAIIKVLREGIKYGGASAPDNKYVNLQGLGGKYQEHFRVYEREGEKCLRNDGGIIKKIQLGGRGTYFCPICQK
jgi:formamidopyrimidine-DNA glycosylase